MTFYEEIKSLSTRVSVPHQNADCQNQLISVIICCWKLQDIPRRTILNWFKMEPELELIFKDFPAGPLDEYRQSASFKWQDMQILLNGTEEILLKVVENYSS